MALVIGLLFSVLFIFEDLWIAGLVWRRNPQKTRYKKKVSHVKDKIKHRKWIGKFLFSFMIFLLLPAGAPANTPKTAELRNIMSEISSLHGKIAARQAQAFELCEKLKGTMRQLEAEIKIEKQSLKTNSYREAIGSPRIDYNLSLIHI